MDPPPASFSVRPSRIRPSPPHLRRSRSHLPPAVVDPLAGGGSSPCSSGSAAIVARRRLSKIFTAVGSAPSSSRAARRERGSCPSQLVFLSPLLLVPAWIRRRCGLSPSQAAPLSASRRGLLPRRPSSSPCAPRVHACAAALLPLAGSSIGRRRGLPSPAMRLASPRAVCASPAAVAATSCRHRAPSARARPLSAGRRRGHLPHPRRGRPLVAAAPVLAAASAQPPTPAFP